MGGRGQGRVCTITGHAALAGPPPHPRAGLIKLQGLLQLDGLCGCGGFLWLPCPLCLLCPYLSCLPLARVLLGASSLCVWVGDASACWGDWG